MNKINVEKTVIIVTGLLCMLVGLSILTERSAHAQAEAPVETMSAALLKFEASGHDVQELAEKATSLMDVQLSTAPSLIMVERAELEKALGEQELALSGMVNAQSAVKIGELTGAQVIISGELFTVDRDLYLVAKILGVETGRVYGESVSFPISDPITKGVGELAAKVTQAIADKSSTLLAKHEKTEDMIVRLKPLVEGKKLPTVSVSIIERHVGRAALDPAAQTEIGLILKELGFPIVSTSQKADIIVSGEAFSEFGMRRGNLVSIRGRVEVSAERYGTHEVLFVDRQTQSVVDLSEEIGGKEALQRAASTLAERLVKKLIAS